MRQTGVKTRFAPSPSGFLHLGHVFAAYRARSLADKYGGECLLRIEDIDLTRCREVFKDAIYEDLDWLGFRFDGDIVVQSARTDLYERALDRLKKLGVLYPCFCTRKSIERELALSASAPQGERIDPYPGICRRLTEQERLDLLGEGMPHSWRLDCRMAADLVGMLSWEDLRYGMRACDPALLGDVILGRKDCPASYHVAVVVDDAEQGITHVTRGEDLLEATHVHRVLHELLGFPVPVWFHHPLVRDGGGKRLAKRDRSLSIREMKAAGVSASEVVRRIQCMDMELT